MSYAERQVKLSEIMEKVEVFSYNILDFLLKGVSHNDKIGEFYFYRKWRNTIGKCDRSKFGISAECEFIS